MSLPPFARSQLGLFFVVLGAFSSCTRGGGPVAPDRLPVAPAAEATRGSEVATPAPEPIVSPRPRGPSVEALLAGLTLEQKVGQLMMVGFKGTEVDAEIEALVRGRQVGGVCMFRRNITGAEQIAQLNDQVRELLADQVPPFIALDQEGGNVVRLQHGAVLPGNMALGATHSPALAYEAGRVQAEDLLLLGFNMNLAPVLDVNLNPKNPVIGIRSFGDQPDVVAEFGREFVRGQQEANIVTVAKHFPGHGNTDEDSHVALPVMSETREELMEQLLPFTRVMGDGLDGLMTAHVAIPKLTGSAHPATVSKEILTGLLRSELRYDGLVITDELEMEAIVHRYGVGKAAVMSVQAGADMVLVPWRAEKKTEVFEALLAAARSGELSSSRIDEAVRRILALKVKRGLFERPKPVNERLARFGAPDRLAVVKEIARRSVTLLRADPRQFPIRPSKKIAVFTAEAALGKAISARAPDAEVLVVPAYPSSAARAELRQQARELALESDVVVVGMINSRQVDLALVAAAAGKPVIVVSMGLPYLVDQVQDARAVLAVYSYQESSTEAAAAALFGEAPTPGRLPVSLGGTLRFGFGLDAEGQPLAAEGTGYFFGSLEKLPVPGAPVPGASVPEANQSAN